MREGGKGLVGSSPPRKSCRIYVWYSTSRGYKSIYNLQLVEDVEAHLVHNMYQKSQPTVGKYASPMCQKMKAQAEIFIVSKWGLRIQKSEATQHVENKWKKSYSYKDSGGNDTLQ